VVVKNPFPDKEMGSSGNLRNSSRKSSKAQETDILDQFLNQNKPIEVKSQIKNEFLTVKNATIQ
jgi:hypothetical protein